MNRFHLMTCTAALALAISACASATRPGADYALRQQLLLAQDAHSGQRHQPAATGRRPTGGGGYC